MKKTSVFLLAAAMLLSLAACGKEKEPEPVVTIPPMTEAPMLTEAPELPTEAPTEATVAPVETLPILEAIETIAPETQAAEVPQETAPKQELPSGFKELDDTVYAKRDVNIRAEANVKSELKGKLLKGESLKRIGRSKSNQWSAVIYKDEMCFVATEYLSNSPVQGTGNGQKNTNQDVTETEATGTVYTTSIVRLRKGPGTNTTMLESLPKNAALQRLALCNNNWVKVSYGGTVGYVAGGYLTEKEPAKPVVKAEKATDEEVAENNSTTEAQTKG